MRGESSLLVQIAVGVFGALFILGGGFALVEGFRTIARIRRARRWPSTEGRILDSGGFRHVDHDEQGPTVWHGVEIRYEYSVRGQRFESGSLAHTTVSFSKQRDADAVLRRYPAGSKVKVYYDPASPDSSVLEHTAHGLWLFFWIGVLFPLVGMAFLYLCAPVFGTRADPWRLQDRIASAWRTARFGAYRVSDSLVVFGADRHLDIRETVTRYARRDNPGDAVVMRQRPTDRVGPVGRPHYGIGGFHRFESAKGTLAHPAKLAIGWAPEEVAWLDESSLAIYRWNEARGEWDHLGGERDPQGRRMSVMITQLGEYTLAPKMPGGVIDLTVYHEADRYSVAARQIKLNTGEHAPDGTCVDAVLTREREYVDGFVGQPGSPVTHGVRGRISQGALQFDVRKIKATLQVFSCEGTAYGSFDL